MNILNAYEIHLDFPKHIFITVSYRFISSLEAIKGKKSEVLLISRQGFHKVPAGGLHFQVKLRSEACRLGF